MIKTMTTMTTTPIRANMVPDRGLFWRKLLEVAAAIVGEVDGEALTLTKVVTTTGCPFVVEVEVIIGVDDDDDDNDEEIEELVLEVVEEVNEDVDELIELVNTLRDWCKKMIMVRENIIRMTVYNPLT
jgi:transcription termination factor NusB